MTFLLLLFWDDTKLSNLIVVEVWASLSIICRRISKRYLESIKKKIRHSIKHELESYLQKSSAEKAIMIHERTVSKNKQSIDSIESELFNASQEFSNRSMRNNRRVLIIFTEIFEDKFENAKIFYHVRNVSQLKYWLKKDENALIKAWVNIRDESTFVMNEYNKKIVKFEEFITEYNNCIDELNDVKLIICELKVKLRERDISESENSNTSLSITEKEVIVATFKKLSNSSVFTDDKNLIIDDWLSAMRNKLEENANWFSIDVQQKAYVRIKIEDDAMKHLISRFFKNSIKSYIISKKIFDDLYQIFHDSNRRINALKAYRRLKQVESFKDFNTFWTEFQRLISDSELYNQKTLLEDLKNKMSYELQKTLAIESYKATDLHEFVKMCRYTNQTLKDVNNKSRREEFFSDAARDEEVIVIVNSNQNNQNTNRSISRSRFEISESSSRVITQSSENQMNFINCYNCEKSDHFFRNCRQFRKMNSNNFVREMNVHEKNDSFIENSDIESKKD